MTIVFFFAVCRCMHTILHACYMTSMRIKKSYFTVYFILFYYLFPPVYMYVYAFAVYVVLRCIVSINCISQRVYKIMCIFVNENDTCHIPILFTYLLTYF